MVIRSPAAFIRPRSGTVTFFRCCSIRNRPPRTDGPGGRLVRSVREETCLRLACGSPSLSGSAPRPQPGVSMLALVLSLSLCFPSRSFAIPALCGSGSLPASKRNVVLYPQLRGPYLLDQVGQIAAMLDEVDVRAVDHQEWC